MVKELEFSGEMVKGFLVVLIKVAQVVGE